MRTLYSLFWSRKSSVFVTWSINRHTEEVNVHWSCCFFYFVPDDYFGFVIIMTFHQELPTTTASWKKEHFCWYVTDLYEFW